METFKSKISIAGLFICALAIIFLLAGQDVKALAQEKDLCSEQVMLPMGGDDIEAAFTGQWGWGAPGIKIFGRDAALGETLTAPLSEYEQDFHLRAFMDPLPVHNACPGYGYFRDANMSIITRVTLGNRRVLILVRHAGGRGFKPGNEGFLQVRNGWSIAEVLSDQGPDNSYSGFGTTINIPGGRVEWQGRGGCPACACLENHTKISLVVEKNSTGPLYTPFVSTRTTDADVEAAVTNQWGWGAPPIYIFGDPAGVGQVATATLSEYEEKYALCAFEDPLPVYGRCPGYGYIRDANMSVISRISLGKGRVLVVVRHDGARGNRPGSEGYVQLGNGWRIEKVISAGNDNYSFGFGVRIDQENGTVEWQGRTGCPGCACHEGPAFISVVASKRSDPVISSIDPDSGPIGVPVTIHGSFFGSSPGSVTFSGIEAGEVISWSDTEIVARVPAGAVTGPVVVHTADNKDSNDVTFTVESISAVVDVDPDTLNRKSKGKWVTVYIELPAAYDVNEIKVDTVKIVSVNGVPLEEPLQAEAKPTAIGDYDLDGAPDLMVKFSRAGLIQAVSPGQCTLIVKGELNNGAVFESSDTIRVIK